MEQNSPNTINTFYCHCLVIYYNIIWLRTNFLSSIYTTKIYFLYRLSNSNSNKIYSNIIIINDWLIRQGSYSVNILL